MKNTQEKPVILIFVRHYLPGFRAGGPLQSVSNLVKALDHQFDFRIVCLDHDLGENTRYREVELARWNKLGNTQVYYASEKEKGFALTKRVIDEVTNF